MTAQTLTFVDRHGWEWRFLPYAFETPDNGDLMMMERSDGEQAKYPVVVEMQGFEGVDESGGKNRYLRASWSAT